MKTKNIFRKTTLGSLALLICTFLISTSLSAIESRSKSKTKGVKAPLSFVANKTVSLSETRSDKAFNYDIEIEKPLEIEPWMINEKNFETAPLKVRKELKEKQVAMEIQNKSKYGRRLFVIFVDYDEDEPALKIEKWMVNQKKWEVK